MEKRNEFTTNLPASVTADTGMDVLTHALEAYVSNMASDYTDGLSEKAVELVFKYLKEAYEHGDNRTAREKMHNASTIAGMSFTNAFLGVCHSMAHKLGAFHHLPHGVANALMINEVIKFNSSKEPVKMGTFSQYSYPHTLERYGEIADYLGLGGETSEDKLCNLLKAIDELKEKIGIKKSIKEYGINEEEFLNKLDTTYILITGLIIIAILFLIFIYLLINIHFYTRHFQNLKTKF